MPTLLSNCLRALELAREALASAPAALSAGPNDALALIGAEIVAGTLERWQLTFKPRAHLLPARAEECITLGGEYFVTVDLRDGTTAIRFGE